MKVAAVQMASGSNLKGNLLEAEKQIANAAQEGAELVSLPENFGMIGVRQEDVIQFREMPGDGPLQNFLSEQARQHGIVIAGGSVPLVANEDNKFRNTQLVYDQQGKCIARYDKVHLFDVTLPENKRSFRESDVIEAGDSAVVVDIAGVRVGLTICYDLRFPELFRLLLEKGAEVILVPAAFTAETGKAHWRTLLKARAIENLCFIVAAAQGGFHVNGCETFGHSLIVDPWGKVLDEIATGSGYAMAELNLDYLRNIRDRFPSTSHRKFFYSPNQGES